MINSVNRFSHRFLKPNCMKLSEPSHILHITYAEAFFFSLLQQTDSETVNLVKTMRQGFDQLLQPSGTVFDQ